VPWRDGDGHLDLRPAAGDGVDPDIEVVPNPARLAQGVDEQLDRAISEMLDALQSSPVEVPDVPDYPDRSGMGISEDDK
jgi:C-terminal processing protease CtpA/Prc